MGKQNYQIFLLNLDQFFCTLLLTGFRREEKFLKTRIIHSKKIKKTKQTASKGDEWKMYFTSMLKKQ